jgi:hypothetical protein
MEPSSLVLVAIIGVWAAYLVPHWLRRREDLAQSRTPDRFSSRLRVLERRRQAGRSGHRSGDALLTSPRVVVDTDGELLYVPARRPATAVDDAERPAAGRGRDREVTLAVALAGARAAARRRAVIMLGLLLVTVGAGVSIPLIAAPGWAVAPSGVLLVMQLMASRGAAIRSRENLAVLAEQARAVTASATAKPAARRPEVTAVRPAAVRPVAAGARPTRRPAVAAGAETWDPIPVPAPTYTLKPAVFRPEPPPLDLPASASAGPSRSDSASVSRPSGWRPAAAGSRSHGSLPRRAEDIERILALDSDPLGLQARKAVNA